MYKIETFVYDPDLKPRLADVVLCENFRKAKKEAERVLRLGLAIFVRIKRD